VHTRVLDTAELVGQLVLDEWKSTSLLSTKSIVSLCVGAALLGTRGEPAVVLLVIGALANAAFGKLAKQWLAQPRPGGALLSDPGMPSSHALSLFFLASFVAAASLRWGLAIAWRRHSLGPSHESGGLSAGGKHTSPGTAVDVAAAAAVLLMAAGLSHRRVADGLHTVAQVACGSLVGSLSGFCWFLAVDRWLARWLRAALAPWHGRLGLSGAVLLLLVGVLVLSGSSTAQRDALRKIKRRWVAAGAGQTMDMQ
jgi:membrane-associated phospholipid phosphatase